MGEVRRAEGVPKLVPFSARAGVAPRYEHARVTLPGHGEVDAISLHDGASMRAHLLGLGATLTALQVPDADGEPRNVVLGFPEAARYAEPQPYFGATVGRFANRIAHGRFVLDAVTYGLDVNDGDHHLHGGRDGLHRQRFAAEPFADSHCAGVIFSRIAEHGEGGYPGRLSLHVIYRLMRDGALRIDYYARTDRPTVLNLTNHSYWNLADGGGSPVLGHRLWIAGDQALDIDADGIPTGRLRPVRGSALDFTEPRAIGERIEAVPERGGYDHCFVLPASDGREPRLAAVVHEPVSGRMLEVWTTQPALQVYSGNMLDGSLVGHGAVAYGKRCGLCLETQHFPDAPNHPSFPTTRLGPDEYYAHAVVYRFGMHDRHG